MDFLPKPLRSFDALLNGKNGLSQEYQRAPNEDIETFIRAQLERYALICTEPQTDQISTNAMNELKLVIDLLSGNNEGAMHNPIIRASEVGAAVLNIEGRNAVMRMARVISTQSIPKTTEIVDIEIVITKESKEGDAHLVHRKDPYPLCRNNPDPFYREDHQAALKVCKKCLVKAECLSDLLKIGDPGDMVWAEQTPWALRALIKKQNNRKKR